MRALAVIACFALGGCNVAERLANGAIVEPSGEVVESSGVVIEPSGEVVEPADYKAAEIIATENDMCLVRARHFKGLVRVPCDQIAREPAP
jgi:hypothetical protein